MKTKRANRQQLIQHRNTLTPLEHSKLSLKICDKILSSKAFKESKTIGAYLSINNEADISSLINKCKQYVLPVIQSNSAMTFNHFDSLDSLVQNKFGILEPKKNTVIESEYIGLCLMPLVGFKRDGSRLGMGGGYYDRYFELNKFQKTPTILAGVAYDFQEDDTIQSEPWDVPLDIIFTNKEVIIV